MRPPSGTFVIPSGVAHEIQAASAPGALVVRIDTVENLALIVGFDPDDGTAKTDRLRPFVRDHYTSTTETGRACRCHAADAELHAAGLVSVMQGGSVTAEYFRSALRGKITSHKGHYVTYAPDAEEPVPQWLGWFLTGDRARFFPVQVVEEDRNPLDYLGNAWPTDALADLTVGVVGVGSIGSSAAEALAGYGIGSVHLVDFDRLMQHNLPRHVLSIADIGRRKTHAMASHLGEEHPTLTVVPHDLDVVHDADRVRDVLPEWDCAVVATDGVESRLASNWLTVHARVPAVFACVLEDGAIGEILRSLPGEGCLVCNRTGLSESGTWDPEPGIDLDYGTGTSHRPMTAVGSDLALVGLMAAKAAVATLLERAGHRDQRIRGNHAAMGLRPARQYAAPFHDLAHGETRWSVFKKRDTCHVCASSP